MRFLFPDDPGTGSGFDRPGPWSRQPDAYTQLEHEPEADALARGPAVRGHRDHHDHGLPDPLIVALPRLTHRVAQLVSKQSAVGEADHGRPEQNLHPHG